MAISTAFIGDTASIDRQGRDGRGRLKPIEVHTYKTPTTMGDQLWSVGLMYVTEAEARLVNTFVGALMRMREGSFDGDTITIPVQRRLTAANPDELRKDQLGPNMTGGPPPRASGIAFSMQEAAEIQMRGDRMPKTGDDRGRALRDQTPKTGDRFSGIDFED